LLIVEDSEEDSDLIVRWLRGGGYDVKYSGWKLPRVWHPLATRRK